MFFGVLKRPGDEGSAVWLPLEASDADVFVHHSPGNTVDDGTPAQVPAMLCGVLQKPGERQFFRLELTKGQKNPGTCGSESVQFAGRSGTDDH